MESDDGFIRAGAAAEAELPDDLLAELDKALDGLEQKDEPTEPERLEAVASPPIEGLSDDPGIRQMQETFLEISRSTLAPLDRYIKAMGLGEPSHELLEISELVVTPLIARTEAVGLTQHAEDLTFFRSLLLLALGERDHTGSNAMKEVVMEGFSKMGERFALEFRGYRPAVRNLVAFYRSLRASDSVSEVDVRRFFAVGIPSLTWVRRAKTAELSNLSGISVNVMREIQRLAAAYRSMPAMRGATLAREDLRPAEKTTPPVWPAMENSEVIESEVLNVLDDTKIATD